MLNRARPCKFLNVAFLIHEFKGCVDIDSTSVENPKLQATPVYKDDPDLEHTFDVAFENAVSPLTWNVRSVEWNFFGNMDWIDTVSIVLFFSLLTSAVFASIGMYARQYGAVKR